MAVLKLVGATRYMNNRLSTHVIERDGLTPDIQDEGLVKSLLNATYTDALGTKHNIFELVEATETAQVDQPVDAEAEDPAPVKKKSTRKKATRTRKSVED